MLTYLEIARRLRPRWVVWENVPGVLSSNGGRDFGSFLGALGELGYGWSYRVLDAQWVRTQRHPRAVPQRRRRVFVVGCLGDARAPAAVLFERESVQRDSAPRRAKGEGAASDASDGARARQCPADICSTLNASFGEKLGLEDQHALHGAPMFVPHDGSHANGGGQIAVAHALRGEGFDASEDSTGRGTPIIPVAPSLTASNDPSRSPQSAEVTQQVAAVHAATMTVRRLTPRECERLQAFPDDYTLIPWRKKPADQCPDGPRYKALGNSMAVNCMEWIGERIAAYEAKERKP